MTTKEKIKYYIDSKGISKNKFYTITGLSTSFLDSGNTIGVDNESINYWILSPPSKRRSNY